MPRANRSAGGSRSGRSRSHQRPRVSGPGVPARALEARPGDLAELGSRRKWRSCAVADDRVTSRSRLASSVNGGCGSARSASASSKGERRWHPCRLGDETEQQEGADHDDVHVEADAAPAGLGAEHVGQREGRDDRDRDEVEEVAPHASAPWRSSRIVRSAPIASRFIAASISWPLNRASSKRRVRAWTASPRAVSPSSTRRRYSSERLARLPPQAVTREDALHPGVGGDHGAPRIRLGLEVVDRLADRAGHFVSQCGIRRLDTPRVAAEAAPGGVEGDDDRHPDRPADHGHGPLERR